MPEPVRQRARYELVVATLRGIGELRSVDDVARIYLDGSIAEDDPVRLRDAATLLMYANGAAQRGVTTITGTELSNWNAALRSQVERLMVDAPPNRRASLLFTLGHLSLHLRVTDRELPIPAEQLPKQGSPLEEIDLTEELVDVSLVMSAWTELALGLEDTPLFPTDLLSDTLRELTLLLVDQPGWRTLVDLVDEAVARVSGNNAVAERARDRAVMLLKVGRRLDALAELHEAKIAWWSGDTIRGVAAGNADHRTPLP